MKLMVLWCLMACGSKGKDAEIAGSGSETRPTAPTTRSVDAAIDATPATEVEPDANDHERAQQEIADALNALFDGAGGHNATAVISDEDLMIVPWKGKCDRQVLADLRKTLVAMKLDPAKAFSTMQCNGGPVLKLK